MVRKAELLIEKFPNGVTVRTNDADTSVELEKAIAIHGSEASCIGESLWDDVRDVLSQSECDKVKVVVEVRPINLEDKKEK